jgi:CubicO group peptidase (beta-lactamase class C family)
MLPRESQYQWIPLVDGLAAQRPWWEPGSKHGYHAVTFGHLVGEVIRRITGGSVGSYFRKQFAEPLGIDAYIGFGRELDDYCANVVPAPMQPPDPANRLAAAFLDPSSLTFKSFMITPEPLINPNYMNSREWRAAEIPAANGHANARALATIYGALANGGTIGGHYVLGAQTIQDARQEESYGEDAVLLGLPTRFGRGFMLEAPEYGLTEGARLFGHPGLGGSFGFADPGANVGIGYAMNKLILPEGFVVDPRWTAIMEAIYQAV